MNDKIIYNLNKDCKNAEVKKKNNKKVIISEFKEKYKRKIQHYKFIREEEGQIYDCIFRASNSLEEDGYIRVADIDFFEGKFQPVLGHIVYKALKTIYNLPDRKKIGSFVTAMTIDEVDEESLHIIEWSYFINIIPDFYIEIMYEESTLFPVFIFWYNGKTPNKNILDKDSKLFINFIEKLYQLFEIVDNDYATLNQGNNENINNGYPYIVIRNLYYDYHKYGENFLSLTKSLCEQKKFSHKNIIQMKETNSEKRILKENRGLFVSSSMLFLLSLEGFVNILYRFLLKDEFKFKEIERNINTNCLELKIIHLPVYCNGFKNTCFTADDVAVKNWSKIRKYRNFLIHANINEQHEYKFMFEDGCTFLYNNFLHQKQSKKDIKEFNFPLLHMLLSTHDVEELKNTIDETVQDIIDKMGKREKRWITHFINEPLIPPPDIFDIPNLLK